MTNEPQEEEKVEEVKPEEAVESAEAPAEGTEEKAAEFSPEPEA